MACVLYKCTTGKKFPNHQKSQIWNHTAHMCACLHFTLMQFNLTFLSTLDRTLKFLKWIQDMTVDKTHNSSIYDHHLGLKMGYFLVQVCFWVQGLWSPVTGGCWFPAEVPCFLARFLGDFYVWCCPFIILLYTWHMRLCGNAKGRFWKCCDWYIIISICKCGLLKLVLYLR